MKSRRPSPMVAVARCRHGSEKSLWLALLLIVCLPRAVAAREPAAEAYAQRPPSSARMEWPTWEQTRNVLLLRDYHTRVVLLGSLLLGVTAGVVGVFMTLRKRALVGDMVGHATLPGIGLAYLVMEMIEPGSGKSFDGLLRGAFLSGLLGVVCVLAIRRYTKIKEDAALAIVLGIFFGLGVALFTVIQNIPSGNAAGLNQFIFGKTHSMLAEDVTLTAQASAVTLLICALFFKEFSLLCFDEQYAAAQGWAVLRLDMLLMLLVVTVTVIGLQSVGLLLVVALLIVPPAAARFWTDSLWRMTLLAGLLGGASAFVAVVLSALISHLPTGPLIVLVGALFFLISLLFGVRRGVLRRVLAYRRLKRRVGRHDLLRACFERLETQAGQSSPLTADELPSRRLSFDSLLAMRSWPPRRLRRLLARAESEELLQREDDGDYRLTPEGAVQAVRAARNHRLWEIYLIHYAAIAPSHVDRDADQIEHILEPELVAELDALLAKRFPHVPPSPHELNTPTDLP